MTPEELLEDLETCTGPCGRMCLSCPESRYVAEIHQVLKDLIEERNKYKYMFYVVSHDMRRAHNARNYEEG